MSTKRADSISKGTYGEYKTLREAKAQELSDELQMISDSQNYQEQMHRIKAAFNKKYDAFVAKRTKATLKRYKALTMAILKAFARKKKNDRRELTMVQFSRQKLDFLQMRRQFKFLKMFADWQRNWVKVVRANARMRLAHACFKQLYLSAIRERTQRAKKLQIMKVHF